MTQTVIPCKRPKVRVNELLGLDRIAAVCDVPACGWRYDNVVKSDVQEQATRHRGEHRSAVPTSSIVGPDPEYDVHCEPCGGHRRTFGTRVDAQAWLDYHLSTEHGLVTCP